MGVVNEEVVITNNVDLAIEGNYKLVKTLHANFLFAVWIGIFDVSGIPMV